VSLEEALSYRGESLRGSTVIVLGGGGTANSIAFALALRGVEVIILNRTVEKARQLAMRINRFIATGPVMAYGGGRDELSRLAPEARAIVSVIDDPESPLDQYSALGEIELPATPERITRNLQSARKIMDSLRPGTVVSDVMLREQKTATLREAEAAGYPTLDGRPMVLNQAIEAFAIVNARILLKKGMGRAEIARTMKSVFKI
jgi:shikimate dehydrogenase